MARTYHHGIKARMRKFGKHFYGGYPQDDVPQKRRRNEHYCEWMNTPGWWVREFMNRPHRAKTKLACKMLRQLVDLEDAPLFPHRKKPHLYYW